MPSKYELIVYTIDAIQVTPDSVSRAVLWCGGMQVEEVDPNDKSIKFVGVNVPTFEGMKRASEGDYILKTVQGSFNVMKRAEFERTYRKVAD